MKSIMPFLLIVLAIALFYVFISPHYQSAKLLQAEANQYEDALQKAEELRVLRDELLTQYNSLPASDIEKLERIVPDSVDIVKLVADIDGVAGKYGIALKDINVKEQVADEARGVTTPENQKPYETTTVSMELTTTYANIIPFLKDIERSLQLVDVKAIEFSSGVSTNNLYTFTLTIQTYWIRN
jgi:Tfp pilus assembly protein PilO